MQTFTFITCILSLLAILLFKRLILNRKHGKKNFPPGPQQFPFFGHLPYLLGKPLLVCLSRLGRKYGPMVLLRIGSRSLLLVSSASAAEDCLLNHDIVYANRPPTSVTKFFGVDHTVLGFTDYGPHWRTQRRTVTTELLSAMRLNKLSHIQTEEVELLAEGLAGAAEGHGFVKVELRHKFAKVSLNILMRMVTGVKTEEGDPEAEIFIGNLEAATALAGTNFPGDSFLTLKVLDRGRFVRRLREVRDGNNLFMRKIFDERRRSIGSVKKSGGGVKEEEEGGKCLVDVLIKQQELDPESYTDEIVLGILAFMLTAGVDTSSITMEWAMARLINHPHVLQKIRDEMETTVGRGRPVAEKDLPKLPYLQAVISETLRLHPPLPLLFPHRPSEDTVIAGYDIPAGTSVFINAVAIQRDPSLWEEPEEFKPERFLDNQEMTTRTGAGCKYVPFGAGRRRCPGELLGVRNVGLALATLVQRFDWKSVDGGTIDMEDDAGLSLLKKVPLEAMYKVRDSW